MTSQIEKLEQAIEYNQIKVDQVQYLNRLLDNSDFKKVVFEGYFKNFAQECVYNMASPNFVHDEAERKDLENEMLAIAYFKRWLHNNLAMAEQAEHNIDQARTAIAEIHAAGNDEEENA